MSLLNSAAFAQWASQTLQLRGGWNAVYLEVQPEPRGCELQLASLPVESVWRFNRGFGTVQFIDDPNELVNKQPDWLMYLPPGNPLGGRSTLHALEGGRAYLIKLADNAGSVSWNVRGVPALRVMQWLPDSLNLVGFGLPASTPPNFRLFLTNSAALATNPVYRLSTDGKWIQMSAPEMATTPMRRGESFWIRATGPCDYSGTIEVQLEQATGLNFGQSLVEQTVQLRNAGTATRTVTMRVLASEPPPVGAYPALAGPVPLDVWQLINPGSSLGWTNPPPTWPTGWTNFPTQLVLTNVPAGGTRSVRLAVRRADMARYVPRLGVTQVQYQSILEITDGLSRILVPVTASGF